MKPFIGSMFVFGAATAVHAAAVPVTFAQAIESSLNADANVFSYTNNGAGNDAELSASNVALSFTYLSGAGSLPSDLTGVQTATLSMTSSTSAPVMQAFGGTFDQQAIDGSGVIKTDVIKITRTTPAAEGIGTKTNLLTVTFTGHLSGPDGGTTPSLSADTALKDTVTYSSDFLSFAATTQQDFNVAFSSWAPLITPPTGLGVNSDTFFNSATAAGAATFDFQGASSVIPEPTSLPTAIFGGLVVVLACGRNFRSRDSRAAGAVL
jgi:hypothetical protein